MSIVHPSIRTRPRRQPAPGFTIVELIVVILLLSVLAATALPRFMDVNDETVAAAVEGTGNAFGSAVAQVRAQWVSNGLTGAVDNVSGFSANNVDTNASGWPVGTGDTNTGPTASQCVEVWHGLLHNPPAAATAVGSEYLATASGTTCTFTYSDQPALSIQYDASNGQVTVDSTI